MVAFTATTAGARSSASESPDAPAPSAVPRDQPPRDTERQLRSPGSSVFWIDSGVGYEHVGLTTLHVQRDSTGRATFGQLAPASRDGPTIALGLGLRWLFFTLGARVTAAFFSDAIPGSSENSSQFYSIDAELGFRVPAGRFEPYVLFGAGYSVFGGLGDALSGVTQGLNVDGANLRLGFGLDYFLTNTWSIGVRGTGELLFLSPSGVPIRDLARPESVNTVREARTRLAEGEGSSAGTAFSITIGPGVHF